MTDNNTALNYIVNLPGGDLILKGINDLRSNKKTVEACLVLIISPHLEFHKIEIPETSLVFDNAYNHELYKLLCDENLGDAFSRYRALLGQMHSFTRALT